MKKIASFTVDHNELFPGFYVSRIDGDVTSYDMRFCKPNTGVLLSNSQLHSFEHLFATYIRNSVISENIIYFGPMGCQTGFYLLVRNSDNNETLEVIKAVLDQIIIHKGEMFGASAAECGNYKNLSVEDGKILAKMYIEILEKAEKVFQY